MTGPVDNNSGVPGPRRNQPVKKTVEDVPLEAVSDSAAAKQCAKEVNSSASQARAQNFDWQLKLVDFFASNFTESEGGYAYVGRDKVPSRNFKLSKEEYEHILASLKVYQNKPKDFSPQSGILALDEKLDPLSLALAQAYMDLKADASIQPLSSQRDDMFRILIGRLSLTNQVAQDPKMKDSANHTLAKRDEAIDFAFKALQEKLGGLSQNGQNQARLLRVFDAESQAGYKGPIAILIPEKHHGRGAEAQSVQEAMIKQSSFFMTMRQPDITGSTKVEGTVSASIDWRALDERGAIERTLAGASFNGSTLAGRILSARDKEVVKFPAIETNKKLFLENVLSFAMQDSLVACTPLTTDERAKSIRNTAIQNITYTISNSEPEEAKQLVADFNESAEAMFGHFRELDKFLELKEVEIAGFKVKLPEAKVQATKDDISESFFAMKNLSLLYSKFRSREIIQSMRSEDSAGTLMAIGGDHVPEIIVEESFQKQAIPIYVVNLSTELETNKRILELVENPNGFADAKAQLESTIGQAALNFQRNRS